MPERPASAIRLVAFDLAGTTVDFGSSAHAVVESVADVPALVPTLAGKP